jgi:hypothetical protein
MWQVACRYRTELALVGLLALLGAAAHGSNRLLEARFVDEGVLGDVGPLPDGKALRVLSLGFDRLVADLFWLRTVYYIGDDRSFRAGYPAAERLAMLVTDIDPEFRTVYVLMSGALSGLARDPEAATRLLEKGVAHVEYWKLHFLLGFNYFIERLDFPAAARQMQIAAGMEGSPVYLPLLASRLYAQGGDPETAIAFIRARLAEEQHEDTRKALEKRYWDLWITRDLRQIDRAIAQYRAGQGAEPTAIEQLVTAGLLERSPADPKGGAYRIVEGHATTELDFDTLRVHVPYKPTPSSEEVQYQYKRMQGGEASQ